jgi:hypothetical protein
VRNAGEAIRYRKFGHEEEGNQNLIRVGDFESFGFNLQAVY